MAFIPYLTTYIHIKYLADKCLNRKSLPIPKPRPRPPRLSLPAGPNSYYSKPGHVLSTTTNSYLIPSRQSVSKVKPGHFPPPTAKPSFLRTHSVDNVSTTSHTSQPSHFPPPITKPPPLPKQLATSVTTYASPQLVHLPPPPAMQQTPPMKSAESTTNCTNRKKRSFSMILPPAVTPKPTGHHTYDMVDDSQKVYT